MTDRGMSSLIPFVPSVKTWRHRDGGRVVDVFTATWQLTICWSRRRRDRHGVLQPLYVTLNRWPQLARKVGNA